jgi:hypothetical protein
VAATTEDKISVDTSTKSTKIENLTSEVIGEINNATKIENLTSEVIGEINNSTKVENQTTEAISEINNTSTESVLIKGPDGEIISDKSSPLSSFLCDQIGSLLIYHSKKSARQLLKFCPGASVIREKLKISAVFLCLLMIFSVSGVFY